jgi:hypothetical protein
MPIVSVKEQFSGRDTSQSVKRERTYKRVFHVLTDDPRTGGFAVRAALGIQIGEPYQLGTPGPDLWAEGDTGSFATSIRASVSSEDGLTWTAEVDYGPYEPETAESPLDEPEDVSWDQVTFEIPVDYDANGTAILNSAGDPYDPPVMIEDDRPVLTIVRNELEYNSDLSDLYRGSVNASAFFGKAPGTVKCMPMRAQRLWSPNLNINEGYYWKVTYTFHVNRDGWKRKLLDQGYQELVSGVRKKILVDGLPASQPQLLNGSGLKLAVGSDPVYKEFTVHKPRDFSVFNFSGA